MDKELASGLVIAAPASGSGKTVVTLSLLRALKNSGVNAASFKIGPDYIDPAYHAAASGDLCRNLDFWAMREDTLHRQRVSTVEESDLVITEGVMGLFDGATTGAMENNGSTADAANWLNWPVLLVVDAKSQGASAAALVEGFANHREDITVAGVIFNRVGSLSHEAILREALETTGLPCLGCIPRHSGLDLPSRHLGLIQAKELPELDSWLDEAAKIVAAQVDLELIAKIAGPSKITLTLDEQPSIPNLGQHTAIARDDAFAFCYDHVVEGWRTAGVAVSFFSPLAGEAPDFTADSIYLPGGYPELHAAEIANNQNFLEAMQMADANGSMIYGECGGFMVLGDSLTDRDGVAHEMLGLLPVKTSFAKPKLHLGYRQLSLLGGGALGAQGSKFKGHEFHCCDVTATDDAASLFQASDARGKELPEMGCKVGNVMGSFAHIIDSV
jgi:cobyrinic acid a,c-diamide synthase